jgi:hypothetical protein
MDSIDKIKLLKENIQDEILKEMDNLVPKLKEYVTVDHPNNSKYQIIENICTKINYGCEENRYYYYWLTGDIEFIYRYNLWRVSAIYYDNKHKLWYIYNKDKNNYAEFNELNICSQITILEKLYNILNK